MIFTIIFHVLFVIAVIDMIRDQNDFWVWFSDKMR